MASEGVSLLHVFVNDVLSRMNYTQCMSDSRFYYCCVATKFPIDVGLLCRRVVEN